MKWVRSAVGGVAVLALAVGSLHAAGYFPYFPIVGQSSYCSSVSGIGNTAGTGSPSITGTPGQFGQGFPNNQGGIGGNFAAVCNDAVNAGPLGLTGRELIPADTQLSQGQQPQTVLIPTALLVGPDGVFQGSGSLTRNLMRNGDISVNPFQRGASQAADISNTLTYGADGFSFLGGASSAINWSSQTGATDIVANQFTKSLRFQRKAANADTAQVCQINVMTSQDSVALQGQNFVYSFWVKAGANFSPTTGNAVVNVAYGTGSDQSAATFKAGTWTGQTSIVTAGNVANSSATSISTSFPITVASGTATVQVLPTGATAQWMQVFVSGAVPATATQVGTSICFTPVGTAGANDWIETSNHQLEIVGSGVVTPTSFEHHSPQLDLSMAQRFFTILTEPASGVQVPVTGNSTSATAAAMSYRFPVTMRSAPTFTALGTALGASTWTNKCGNVNNVLASTFIVTATANITDGASLTVTSSGSTIGFGCVLTGAGGGSILSWSAEL